MGTATKIIFIVESANEYQTKLQSVSLQIGLRYFYILNFYSTDMFKKDRSGDPPKGTLMTIKTLSSARLMFCSPEVNLYKFSVSKDALLTAVTELNWPQPF